MLRYFFKNYIGGVGAKNLPDRQEWVKNAHFAPYHFCTGFNKYFYEHHLGNNGFEIVEMSPNGDYSHFVAQEVRRVLQFYGPSPLYVKVAAFMILRFLNVKSKTVKSDEFGCFGYHVKAIKKY